MTKQVLPGMRGTMHCNFLEAFPGGMKHIAKTHEAML